MAVKRLVKSPPSKLLRKLTAYLQPKTLQKVVIVAQWAALLVLGSLIIILMSYFQSHVADEFVTTYIFKNIQPGYIHAAAAHTNILKIPILWIVANLHFGYFSYVALNTLFVMGSFVLWTLLLAKVFDRRALGFMALLFVVYSFCAPLFTENITEATIRNIEYPLALWIVVLCLGILRTGLAHRKKLVLPTILLSLLVLHDYFFLYTLVPALLIATLLWATTRRRFSAESRGITAISLLGALGGVVLTKLVGLLGLLTIVHGYAEPAFASLHDFPRILKLTIKQVLDLFGANIIGAPVRLTNLATLLLFITFCIILFTIIKLYFSRISKQEPTLYFFHLVLSLLAVFTLLAYMFGGKAASDNIRYLTLLVYVGITYLGWLLYSYKDRFPDLNVMGSVLLMLIIFLSLPKVHENYAWHKAYAATRRAKIQGIVNVSTNYGVQTLMAPNGYAAIRFYSHETIEPIVELANCNTVSSLTNNTSWLQPSKRRAASGIIVDAYGFSKSAAMCNDTDIRKIYGSPTAVVPIPSLMDDSSQASLYIYNYDVRTKLDLTTLN